MVTKRVSALLPSLIAAGLLLASCGGGGGGGGPPAASPPAPPTSPSAPPAPPSPPSSPPSSNAPADVVIDTTRRFQTLSGWEITPRMWEQDKDANRYDGTWLNYREAIIDALANQVGINRIRIEVASGAENPVDYWSRFASGQISYTEFRNHRYEKINDNSDPRSVNAAGFQFAQLDYQVDNVLLPLRQRLLAKGERLVVNLCYVDFRPDASAGNVNHAASPEEYAELMAATVQHLRTKYGITPDFIELSLEPENTAGWGGAQLGQGLAALGARLESAGVRPKFIAPSTTSAANAVGYFNAMLAQPGASARIGVLGYHSYDGPSDATRSAILARAQQAGVETAMLEHLAADAAELFRDLTVANATAWQQYGAASLDTPARESQGAYYVLVNRTAPAGLQVRLAGRTRALSQVFKLVRTGAVRVGATGGGANARALAFVASNGKATALVIRDSGGSATFGGLPSGTYGVQYTTDSELAASLGDITIQQGQTLQAAIPAAGVLAVYQK